MVKQEGLNFLVVDDKDVVVGRYNSLSEANDHDGKLLPTEANPAKMAKAAKSEDAKVRAAKVEEVGENEADPIPSTDPDEPAAHHGRSRKNR